MARFHPLTVANVRKTTRDAVEVTFDLSDSSEFSFIQGQYLTFRREFEGTEIRRSYSICAGAHEDRLQVGIKRVEGHLLDVGDPKAGRKCSPDKIVVHTLHAMLVDLSTFAPNDVSLGVNPAKMVPAAGR